MAVGEYLALRGVQAERRGNLDSLAGCGIIGTHVLCTIEAVQFELGGLTFCVPGLSPRRVLAVVRESKTGAAQGKPWDSARFLCEEIFSCGIGSGQRLYRSTSSDHEQHGQVYRRMRWTDGK
ncbi:MAG TPA: hypothetical protein PLN86_03990 [Candidatus Hydrogenedentes bacterium]|nr:hypothetical protein [Candidatus Hydrogenedentota bacterium]